MAAKKWHPDYKANDEEILEPLQLNPIMEQNDSRVLSEITHIRLGMGKIQERLTAIEVGQVHSNKNTGDIVDRLDELNGRTRTSEQAIAVLQDRDIAQQRHQESVDRMAEQRARDENLAKELKVREESLAKLVEAKSVQIEKQRAFVDKILALPWIGDAIIVLGLALIAAAYFAGTMGEIVKSALDHWKK